MQHPLVEIVTISMLGRKNSVRRAAPIPCNDSIAPGH